MCALVTGVQTCALPILHGLAVLGRTEPVPLVHGELLPRSAVLVAGSAADPVRAGPGVLEGRPVSRRLALREPAGPAQYPQGEPCRPAGHRARAVPLQPPRTGAALGAGAVSDRADGAAGHEIGRAHV